MKISLRALRRTALLLPLTVAGMAATSQMAPTSHAAPVIPHITAMSLAPRQLVVTGNGFTPGGIARVTVRNPSGYVVTTAFTTVKTFCDKHGCLFGDIRVALNVFTCGHYDYVIARNWNNGYLSNWVPVYVKC